MGLGGHQIVEDICVEATADQKSPCTKEGAIPEGERLAEVESPCDMLIEMEKDVNHLNKILDIGDILTKDPFKQTDRGRASDWRGTRENKQHDQAEALAVAFGEAIERLSNLCFLYPTVETTR